MSIELLTGERLPLYDHCGILGILSPTDSVNIKAGVDGLGKLQTRGYDGAGLVGLRSDGTLVIHKGQGTINEVFSNTILEKLSDIGFYSEQLQTRYGTSGDYNPENVQPFVARHCADNELFLVSHNGQFVRNPAEINQDKSDTLLFVQRLANTPGVTWEERISNALSSEKGAWSLIISTSESMFLSREGIRPLYYAQRENDNREVVWAAASETVALNEMGFNEILEVMPSQLLRLDKGSKQINRSQMPDLSTNAANCMFENVYIMNEESKVFIPRSDNQEVNNSITIEQMRYRCGQILAQEYPLTSHQIDVVIGIPGTGIPGAKGYADTLGLPYRQWITDKDSVESEKRTFMEPQINQIYKIVTEHFNFDMENLFGLNVALGDDSIVRGNVSEAVARFLVHECGVASVYYLIFCPPIDDSCYLGINTKTKDELIATRNAAKSKNYFDLVENIRQDLGIKGLAFISDEGLIRATGAIKINKPNNGFCMGCMYGHKHPIGKRGEAVL